MGDIDEGWAIVIAALWATLGWLYAARKNREALRDQQTYALLQRHNEWPKFDENLLRVREMIRANDLPVPSDKARLDDIKILDFILDYYEYLSSSVWLGYISEDMLKECELSRIENISSKLSVYIKANRIESASDEIWLNLQLLAARWRWIGQGSQSSYDRAVEWLILKPCPSLAHEKIRLSLAP